MTTVGDFAARVKEIILEGNDYEDIDSLHKKYIDVLQSPNITIPAGTSSGADTLTTLIDAFEYLIYNGSLEQVCMDDADYPEKYAWYPFIIDYTWSDNVIIYAVNLITRWIAKRTIQRATDYTSHDELPSRMLKQLPLDEFILPTHNYIPQCDYPLYDADHSISISHVNNEYVLDFDGKNYIYDVITKILSVNGTQLHSSDDDIADFDAIMIGAGYKLFSD